MRLARKIRAYQRYLRNYSEFKRQLGESGTDFRLVRRPMLEDRHRQSGTASGHYFHQDLLVAQKVFENAPTRHVDIGSRVDGFVAHVASFREIEVLDIRELDVEIRNIRFRRTDITSGDVVPEYCDSASCLHALEHFGLGRYGDRVDCNGHLVALENITAMLKSGGKLYLSVPIGSQRVEFDAHRVFSARYVVDMIEQAYEVDSFSYVAKDGRLLRDVELDEDALERNFDCRYGLGIFELTKRGAAPASCRPAC